MEFDATSLRPLLLESSAFTPAGAVSEGARCVIDKASAAPTAMSSAPSIATIKRLRRRTRRKARRPKGKPGSSAAHLPRRRRIEEELPSKTAQARATAILGAA